MAFSSRKFDCFSVLYCFLSWQDGSLSHFRVASMQVCTKVVNPSACLVFPECSLTRSVFCCDALGLAVKRANF